MRTPIYQIDAFIGRYDATKVEIQTLFHGNTKNQDQI
jgi:hypothetical protein